MKPLKRTLIALVGAVAIPLAMLAYLANLPGGGRGSLGAILLQVAVVLLSVFLFALFLARLVEQVSARRVRRWLASDEGAAWLRDLPDEERLSFLARLDGEAGSAADPGSGFPVDSSDPSR